MLKREIKVNLKSLIIWIMILISLFLMVFLIYPSIATKANQTSINDLLKMFPKDMLKTFNMDIAGIDSVFGWFKTEGMMMVYIITSLYSGILGATILVKEESDKTSEFLYAKPVTKNKIITSKIICGLLNITILVFVVYLFNLIGMILSDEKELRIFSLLSMSPLLVTYVVYFVTMFVGTFFNKTRRTMGLGVAIPLAAYFIQVISMMSDKVEWLKYLTPYSLAPSRQIITDEILAGNYIIFSGVISIIFGLLIYYRYNKKEIV